ncbi:MAG: hypothetical protein GXP62_20660, partial [Oligoflexia bacterium]|nr:hypothetical protein [Oligoflexia bacterium]
MNRSSLHNSLSIRGRACGWILPSAILCAALSLAAWSTPAQAASSATGEEYLSTGEYAEPNILFVIDRDADMDEPCDDSSTDSCIETVKAAILEVVQHYDWARYGVVGTSSTASSDAFYKIAPVGTSYAELSSAITPVSTVSVDVRNNAEVLEDLGTNYFSITAAADSVDDDGDGIAADWAEAPILYACAETHVIVITRNRPEQDDQVSGSWSPSITPDVTCDSTGLITTGTDTQCMYDNLVYKLYNTDLNSGLSGTQNVTVHTVGIDIGSTTVAEDLYGNASDVIGGAGTYTVAASSDQVLSSILTVMQDIRTGTFSRSTPIVTSSGDRLIYSFYELTGDNPLAEG